MKARENARPCPESPHYFTATLASGVHHFRTPCGPRAARCLQAVGPAGLAVLERMGSADSRPALLGSFSALPGDSLAGLAALAGLAWAHEAQELETPRARDVVEYGEAVWEELEDAGYPWAEIMLIGAVVLSRVMASVDVDREEMAKLDFFGRTPDTGS